MPETLTTEAPSTGKSYRPPPPGLLAALDEAVKPTTGKSPIPPQTTTAKPPETAPAAATPEPPKPTTPPPVAAAPTVPAPSPAPDKKTGPAQLREALDKRDTELHELKTKLASLEESGTASSKQLAEAHTKIANAEERYVKALKRAEELEPLPKRIEEMEKRLQEREERLRIADYTSTDEWHSKYVKPIADAQSEAKALMAELVVTDGEGTQRQATEADFNAVLSAPSLNEAARRARAMFGDEVYQSVVNLRTRIASIQRSQRDAYQNAALESSEYQKRQQATEIQRQEAQRQHLLSELDRLFKSEPEVFNPDEKDIEAREAIVSGRNLINTVFSNEVSPEQRIAAAAKVQANAIKSEVQSKRLAKQAEIIKALETELAQYRRSEPTVETRTGGTPSASTQTGETRVAADLENFLASKRR